MTVTFEVRNAREAPGPGIPADLEIDLVNCFTVGFRLMSPRLAPEAKVSLKLERCSIGARTFFTQDPYGDPLHFSAEVSKSILYMNRALLWYPGRDFFGGELEDQLGGHG